MANAAQLLVLSPDDALLDAARGIVSSLGHAPVLAGNAGEAQRALTRVHVELLCLDSVVPNDELERLWTWLSSDRARPAPPAIFLAAPSASIVPSTLPAFYEPQRDGLVAKPIDGVELDREITRILAARARPEPAAELLRSGSITLDGAGRQLLFAAGGALALTPTEFRLLRYLMERAGEFVSPDELLEQVWGFPPGTGGPEVVRAHVSNLRRKLRGMGEDPQLLRTIPYRGYGILAESSHS